MPDSIPQTYPPPLDQLLKRGRPKLRQVDVDWRALGLVGKTHPAARGECVARLSAQLERFAEQSELLNAFLVSPLLDLHGVEAAPVMERAFAAARVDETVLGDWEDVQIDLGLKT